MFIWQPCSINKLEIGTACNLPVSLMAEFDLDFSISGSFIIPHLLFPTLQEPLYVIRRLDIFGLLFCITTMIFYSLKKDMAALGITHVKP